MPEDCAFAERIAAYGRRDPEEGEPVDVSERFLALMRHVPRCAQRFEAVAWGRAINAAADRGDAAGLAELEELVRQRVAH